MKASYQREAFGACYEEALPLLTRHWREIAKFQDIALDVDVTTYRHADTAGRLRVYTARVDENLVGYAVFAVGFNPHYRASLQAVQDVIYIDQSYRRGAIGLDLLRFAERELAAEGVQVVRHHVKRAHPKLGRILEHMGYEVEDVLYSKRLDVRSDAKTASLATTEA